MNVPTVRHLAAPLPIPLVELHFQVHDLRHAPMPAGPLVELSRCVHTTMLMFEPMSTNILSLQGTMF
eukprot:7223847-Pyramimonas_sp.AAC.1